MEWRKSYRGVCFLLTAVSLTFAVTGCASGHSDRPSLGDESQHSILATVTTALASGEGAAEAGTAERELTAQEVARRALQSVVLVVALDDNQQPMALGSGFLVQDGVIATCAHVLAGAAGGNVRLTGDKTMRPVEGLVASDAFHDLALLSVPTATGAGLPLQTTRPPAVGQTVYVAGNPRGLEGTFSEGIVSGIRTAGDDRILQITAPISPGSSGGPVLDTTGQVIGVAAATFREGQNLNFAIPASYLLQLLRRGEGKAAPLSSARASTPSSTVLDSLAGGRQTQGVEGAAFTWRYAYSGNGEYAFSLRNRLRQPVEDIYCLVIFYDKQGQPLDADLVEYRPPIPAGLAKRVASKVDETVQSTTTPVGADTPRTKVEFRVLDFTLAE